MGVLPSFEGRTNYISSLDDVVANKTVELKQAFDQAGTDLKDYLAVLKGQQIAPEQLLIILQYFRTGMAQLESNASPRLVLEIVLLKTQAALTA